MVMVWKILLTQNLTPCPPFVPHFPVIPPSGNEASHGIPFPFARQSLAQSVLQQWSRYPTWLREILLGATKKDFPPWEPAFEDSVQRFCHHCETMKERPTEPQISPSSAVPSLGYIIILKVPTSRPQLCARMATSMIKLRPDELSITCSEVHTGLERMKKMGRSEISK